MPITEEMKAMLDAAGRADAQDRQAREEKQRDEGERRHRAELAYGESQTRAGLAAPDVFAWLAEPEGRELLAAIGAAGVELLPITPWMDPYGQPRERTCSGSWRFSLTSAGEIEVDHIGLIGAGMGHFRKRVTSPNDLAGVVFAPGVVIALANLVRSGRVMENVEAALRARGASAPLLPPRR